MLCSDSDESLAQQFSPQSAYNTAHFSGTERGLLRTAGFCNAQLIVRAQRTVLDDGRVFESVGCFSTGIVSWTAQSVEVLWLDL